jgi:hypothetical protein
MNPTRRTSQVAVVASALLLTACGGGGDSKPLGTDPFPLTIGDRWDLSVQEDFSSYAANRQVTGTRMVDGAEARVVQVKRDSSATTEELYIRTATEVRMVPPEDAPDVIKALGPLTIMKLPLTNGQQWTQYDVMVPGSFDLDGDDLPEPYHEVVMTSVSGPLTVAVPAGTFTNAYEVATKSEATLIGTLHGDTWSSLSVTHDWYVPGIGLVKRLNQVTPEDGPRTRTRDERLTTYAVASP